MIREETEAGIHRLTIDRPERRNAIDPATARALGENHIFGIFYSIKECFILFK